MAYSDFTFLKLKKDYGLEQEGCNLFEKAIVPDVLPTNRLQQDIADAKLIPLYSEKAKSEAVIFPIIREMKIRNPHISIFSGYALIIEKHQELSGTPDFMISAKGKNDCATKPHFLFV